MEPPPARGGPGARTEPRRHGGALLGARRRLDRVEEDEAQVDDRDLQDHHQEYELPDRVPGHRGSLPRAAVRRTDLLNSPFPYREPGYEWRPPGMMGL